MNIRLENVNFIYNADSANSVSALENISLELGGDGIIAIVGSTGSGKSTLIQLLAGLLKPVSGTILYNGENLYGGKDEKKRLRDLRCHLGMAFQYPEYQLFEETVYDDVAFGPKNLGLSKEEVDERVKRSLAELDITEEYYGKSPFELSGGEMRRVALAGIFAMNPDMLILDEPTAGIDPEGKKKILDKVSQLQRQYHMTVVIVSHNMDEVATYADRVIAMHKGHVMYDCTPRELFAHRDEIEKIGLKVPQVSSFVDGLKGAGFDIEGSAITVTEAADAILKALGR